MVTMADYCDEKGNIIIATRPEYDTNLAPLTGTIPKAQQDNPTGVWTLFPFTKEKISRKQPTAVPGIIKVRNPIWHAKHSSDKTQEEIMEQTTMSPQERARINGAIYNPFKNKKKKIVESTTTAASTTTVVTPVTPVNTTATSVTNATNTAPKLGFIENIFARRKAKAEKDASEEKSVKPVAETVKQEEKVEQKQVQEQPETKPPAVPPIMAEQDFGDEDPAIVAATLRANASKPKEEKFTEDTQPKEVQPIQDIPAEESTKDISVAEEAEVSVKEDVQQSVEEKQEPVKKSRKSAVKKVAEEKPSELTDCGTNVPDPIKIEADATYLFSSYTPSSFRTEMTRILNALRDIEISADMNPGVIQVRLSQICALNDEITQHSISTKMMLDNLFAKDGAIMAEASSNVEGSNEFERKRSLNKILMNFTLDDKTINIIDVKTALGMKMTFYNQITTDLDKKRSILMSYIGSQKIEASLTR